MISLRHLTGMFYRSSNRQLHVNFLFRQLVDFAVPFSASIGGLGGTFSTRSGGLGGTFWEAIISSFQLQTIALTISKAYAKVLFTNLLETKAGLSPDCLKENSILESRGVVACSMRASLRFKEGCFKLTFVALGTSGEKCVRVHRRTMDLPEAA